KQAVDQAIYRYNLLREKYPGKRVEIAEFGWPSHGYNLLNAEPGPFQQAVVLRNFVARAQAIGMDYNIVEAIDQPWKYFEGSVGPYWGILMSLPIFRLPEPTVMQALLLSVAANGVGAWVSNVFSFWATHYFMFGSA